MAETVFPGETNDSFSGVFRKTFFSFLLFCFARRGENNVPALELELGFSRSVIGFSCSLTLVRGLWLASNSSTSDFDLPLILSKRSRPFSFVCFKQTPETSAAVVRDSFLEYK